MSPAQHKPRGWLRFTVRTLLVLTVVVAIPLAIKVNSVRAQSRAVKAIRDAGGRVTYDYEIECLLRGAQPEFPAPAWLRSTLGDDFFVEVVEVDLEAPSNHDKDEVMASFAALPRVATVLAFGVSDTGLANLAQTPSISSLSVEGRISDAGLRRLAAIRNLRRLIVRSDLVTNEGIKGLYPCATLRHVDFFGANISHDAISDLKERLPECHVVLWAP